jgi:hypothetical protein
VGAVQKRADWARAVAVGQRLEAALDRMEVVPAAAADRLAAPPPRHRWHRATKTTVERCWVCWGAVGASVSWMRHWAAVDGQGAAPLLR